MKDVAVVHFEDDVVRRLEKGEAPLLPVDRLGTPPSLRTPQNRRKDHGGCKDEAINPSPNPSGGGGLGGVIEWLDRIHSVTRSGANADDSLLRSRRKYIFATDENQMDTDKPMPVATN
jgi:hypothetical protein